MLKGHPTAAAAHFPYRHRNLAEVDAAPVQCRMCGDDIIPHDPEFACAYSRCPIKAAPQ